MELLHPSNGRVLLMDPDRARCAHRCAQLTQGAWQTVSASDVAEALAAVRAQPTDLAMLHVTANEADALDLPRVLRLASGVPHLPVVVLTPAPAESLCCQFLDGEADAILSDSISAAELWARLRALMRVKLLQDELQASREALAASLSRERSLLAQFRQDNAQLQTLCSTDPLTRLHNVRQFDSVLDSEFKIAQRYNRRLSVLTLDLDHFKQVNDTYGHPAGDCVLKEFAIILKDCARESDIVARTGGEEFSLVLPQAGRSQARDFAQRLLTRVSGQTLCVFGREISITCSIGSASFPQDAEATDDRMLVYFADQALLLAKQRGRARHMAFGEMDKSLRRRHRQQFLSDQLNPQVSRRELLQQATDERR